MTEDGTTLIVRRAFNRPIGADWAFLERESTCLISDALGRSGALPHRIRALTTACQLRGPALTVRCFPRDNFAPWAALDMARLGDILVLATGGNEDTAVAGDHFAATAKKWGLRGIVTDGLVRDIRGIEALDLPVFACGITSMSAEKRGNAEVGLNVTIGSATIHPGDIVCGDENGVVIVPAPVLNELRQRFEAAKRDEKIRDAVAASPERSLPDWLVSALGTSSVTNV